ncbi:MAG: hypothetical protein OWQ49_07915 [Aquificaceae bacterium]|nr:hypothetical protein [Aquificaceae bacterium]
MGEEELKELKEVLKEIRDELREIRKEIKQSKQSQSIQTTSEEPPVVYTVPYHYIEIRSFKDFVIFVIFAVIFMAIGLTAVKHGKEIFSFIDYITEHFLP